jgi:hypothetical protein
MTCGRDSQRRTTIAPSRVASCSALEGAVGAHVQIVCGGPPGKDEDGRKYVAIVVIQAGSTFEFPSQCLDLLDSDLFAVAHAASPHPVAVS